ncbi:hypothetical protein LCGC14_3108190, partial [marine sediment metagenome]
VTESEGQKKESVEKGVERENVS